MQGVNVHSCSMFQVGVPGVRVRDVGDGLTVSQLGLEVRLEPMHLTGVQVILKCTALVATLYRQTSVVTMGPRTTEPVPERGETYFFVYVS